MRSFYILCLWLSVSVPQAACVALDFTSCVSNSVRRMGTYFEPTSLGVVYDTSLLQVNLTVTGDMFGTLPDFSTSSNRLTTLQTEASVLQFGLSTTYERFCDHVEEGDCPFGPKTGISFMSTYPLADSYYFVSVNTLLAVIDPTQSANVVACLRTSVTPTFTSSVYAVLTYAPLGILLLLALSVVVAAIYNPWTGTKDFFAWSSNYGQDPDTLRLVTPGFGDMLQYLQFAYFLGSLNLDFPGFYQPALSAVGWSSLQFNISMVSHESHDRGIDNVYSLDGQYGISNQAQLLGMGEDEDVWTCFAVFFLAVIASVIVIAQAAFLGKWIWYKVTSHHAVDLRSKNWPVSGGMIIRILFNYLSLPLVTFCTFQLLVSPKSAVYISVLAGILLLIWIVAATLAVRTIRSTKPQQALYDDLPTLLLLGPLYNTYKERGFMFCFVQLLCTFLRGVVFGAVQPSGTAQITLIAIIEVVYFLSLNVVRPFHRTTSMNVYQIVLSTARLVVTFLSIAFLPSLQVGNMPKGWIAYLILLLHGLIIIFVFFLHSLQTIIEIIARLAGVTGDTSNTFARAFGVRQLARRRRPTEKMKPGDIGLDDSAFGALSEPSTANMVDHSPLDYRLHPTGSAHVSATPSSAELNPASPISPGSAFAYYRMPRRSRFPAKAATWSVDDPAQLSGSPLTDSMPAPSAALINSQMQQVPLDPYFSESEAMGTDSSKFDDESEIWNSASFSHTPRNVDYAVRESDVYFHSRSAATSTPSTAPITANSASALNPDKGKYREPLSSGARPSRRLGTGPADPTGVGAGVRGWFSRQMDSAAGRLRMNRRSKGFVVVRNAPMRTIVDNEESHLHLSEKTDSSALMDGPTQTVKPTPGPKKPLNIVVDQAIPKNSFTPIIRSPIPPAIRRQQQQQQQQSVRLSTGYSDAAVDDGPSARVPSPTFSPAAERQTLIAPEDRSGDSEADDIDTSVGAVRSVRVSDVIRNSQYGSAGFEPGKLLDDED